MPPRRATSTSMTRFGSVGGERNDTWADRRRSPGSSTVVARRPAGSWRRARRRGSRPASSSPAGCRRASARRRRDPGGRRWRPRRSSGTAHPGVALGGVDRVRQQHGPGHRPDATDAGRQPRRDLGDLVGDVGDDLLALERHAGGDDDRARLHHVGGDEARRAGGGDEDVGLAGVRADVGDAGVHDGDRGVGVGLLEGEQVGERPADGEAAADDHHVLAGDRDVVVAQQGHDAGRRARPRARRRPARACRGSPGGCRRRPCRGRR